MDEKEKVLSSIFNDDPSGLLDVKPKQSTSRTADEHLLATFLEINAFVEKHGREPEANTSSVSEFKLYSRLKGLRESPEKIEILKAEDVHGLLPVKPQVEEGAGNYNGSTQKPSTIEEIWEDDVFTQLDADDEGLFDISNLPTEDERAKADFVAKRKKCKNFDQYEQSFIEVQQDLKEGRRKLVPFKQENLRPGDFYVHNGILLFLEAVDFEEEVQEFNSGKRIRKDGRTRTIFENGTESRMLYRSLYKSLLVNGKAVTENFEKVNEDFSEKFSNITGEDEEAGFIYVLKSKSTTPEIASIKNLFKIGFSTVNVADRIKNAEKEPTFLMAPVEYIAGWKCYNMKPQKFEQLIHNFFGSSCLNIEVLDGKGVKHSPREWFVAPLAIIEQAIELIINGKIVHYKYDPENQAIISR